MEDTQLSKLVDGNPPEAPLEPTDAAPEDVTQGATTDADGAQDPNLLVEMASAMHATVARERERMESAIDGRATARVDDLRARSKAETDELRHLADEDVKRIDEWSAAEIARIRVEAKRQSEERRAALEDYIRQHESTIDAEIARVGEVVSGYRERLAAFFVALDDSTDPAEIARLAGSLPVMPNLEALPAEAVSEAAQTAKPESTANGSGAAMLGVVGAAPPTPVSPLTAVVSGAPGPGVTNGDDPSDSAPSDSSDDATVASQQPRRWGPMGLFRTVAPWSATDERDGSSAGEGAATDEPE